MVNTMQSVLNEFIADGLNEGVSREVSSSTKIRSRRSRWREVVLLTAVFVMFRL